MSPLTWRTQFQAPARLAYLLILLLATLTPFRADPDSTRVAERLVRALDPSLGARDVIDAARNLVLFAGWGVVWALTAAGASRGMVVKATASGALVSALVETAQLFSSNRDASLLDVASNTGGSFVGAVGLLALLALASERRIDRSYVGIPALFFAGGYCTAAWLEAVIPLFRQERIPSANGWPTARFAASVAAFRWASVLHLSWSDLPLFLPAGAIAVVALAEHDVPLPIAVRRTVLAGCALAGLAELLHGALGQSILLGAAILHATAVAGGAWLTARLLPRLSLEHRIRNHARALLVGYALVLSAWEWRPFFPELRLGAIAAKLTRRWYVPLAALGGRVDFFSVVDVCAAFFLYLPLGGLLAVWPVRRHGWLAGPLPAVWLAVVLETGQLLVSGRLLDITDVMVQASGAAVGWAIVRRAGYPVYGEAFPEPGYPEGSEPGPG